MQALNLSGLGGFFMGGDFLPPQSCPLASPYPVVALSRHEGRCARFIEKPFNDDLFLECIQRGLQANARQRRQDAQRRTARECDLLGR